MSRLKIRRWNLWVAVALVIANVFAWAQVISAASEAYVVDPIRDPEIEELLNYIY